MHPIATAILTGLFSGWGKGRLTPLPFTLLFALAMAAAYLFGFGFFGALENPALLDRRSVASASQPLGLFPWNEAQLWLFLTLLVAALAAAANVMAKRIRDMGLPGGLATTMLAIMLVVLLGGGSTLQWVTDLFIFLVFLSLLMVPTDHLEAGSGLPRPRKDSGR